MMAILNWFSRVFNSLFGKRKERFLWNEESLYDHFMDKYSLSPDGERFYEAGRSITHFEDPDAYIINYIDPIFDNAGNDLRGHIDLIATPIEIRLQEIEEESTRINQRLDSQWTTGELYQIDLLIDTAKNNESEIESLVFPEKELQKMIASALAKFEEGMENAGEQTGSGPENLDKVIAQKVAFSMVKQIVQQFKDFMDSLSSTRHSHLHPPRPTYIYFFYFVCLLLVCSEIGFSMSVVKGMVNPNIPQYPDLNIYLAILYSVGIAAASAVLMKMLIEKYLFKGKERAKKFVLLLIPMYLVLVLLFFGINDDIYRPGKLTGVFFLEASIKALVISGFSISFALGNAFLFREASYLHHLQFRLNGRVSLPGLRRRRRKYIRKWEGKLSELSCEKIRLTERKAYYERVEAHVLQMFSNLKKICLAAYQRGNGDMFSDVIRQKEELVLAIVNKLRHKLKRPTI